jgi:plasmid maintenance system killer protein
MIPFPNFENMMPDQNIPLQEARENAAQEQLRMNDMMGSIGGLAQQYPDLIRWQLDSEDILIKIENLLRGNVWTGKQWEKKGERLMNDKGIRVFLTELSGFVHKGLITSIYREEDIKLRMLSIGKTINDLIYIKWEEFEIVPANARTIYDIIVLGQIEPAFRRAVNGNYMKTLATMYKNIESVSKTQQPKRSGGLFKMFQKQQYGGQ